MKQDTANPQGNEKQSRLNKWRTSLCLQNFRGHGTIKLNTILP